MAVPKFLPCARLIRLCHRPWRRGFALTHGGVLLLLAGAVIGQRFGFETSLRLHVSAPLDETRMVFSKYASVGVNRCGAPSPYRVALSVDGPEPRMTVESPTSPREVFDVFPVLGKPVALPGSSTQILIRDYWPDFVMKQGEPATSTDQPNNPAILVQLTGPASAPPAECPRPLGCDVRLLRFEAPMDKGADTPSDFRSTVRFSGPAGGMPLDAVIRMNHPASFPAGFWRTALGRNCTFSQAQWNPRDPGETTLHVVHDPGWPFKWLGSLMLCAGMVGMFFFKRSSTA